MRGLLSVVSESSVQAEPRTREALALAWGASAACMAGGVSFPLRATNNEHPR
jgi:hypothetical protein